MVRKSDIIGDDLLNEIFLRWSRIYLRGLFYWAKHINRLIFGKELSAVIVTTLDA